MAAKKNPRIYIKTEKTTQVVTWPKQVINNGKINFFNNLEFFFEPCVFQN